MARRANGEGTIAKRSDGRYDVKLYVDGKRRGWTVRTYADAVAKLKQERRKQAEGQRFVSDRHTTGEYLEHWLETIVRPNLEYSTYRSYRGHVDSYIKPALGRIPITRLRPTDVQRMVSALADQGLSPATTQRVRATLRPALSHAVNIELVTRNVAVHVRMPSVPRPRVQPPSPEQVGQILGATEDESLRALIALAATTGLRQGELLGLQWSNVDLDRGCVAVVQALKVGPDGKLTLGKTKSEESQRLVPVPDWVAAMLRQHRAAQGRQRLARGDDWRDHGLVFTTSVGTPLDGVKVTRRFRAAVAHAGLPRFRFHDLRHFYGTEMMADGASLDLVKRMMGHSQIGLTSDTYGHVTPRHIEQAREHMNRIVDGTLPPGERQART